MKILVLRYKNIHKTKSTWEPTSLKHLPNIFFVLKAIANMENLRKYKPFLVEFCEKPARSHHPALRHSKYAIWLVGWRENNSKFKNELIRSHTCCDVGQGDGILKGFSQNSTKKVWIFANFSCLQWLLKQKKCLANVLRKSVPTWIYFLVYIFVFKDENYHV